MNWINLQFLGYAICPFFFIIGTIGVPHSVVTIGVSIFSLTNLFNFDSTLNFKEYGTVLGLK